MGVDLGVCETYIDLDLCFRVEFGGALGVSAVDVDLGLGLGVSAVEVDLYLGFRVDLSVVLGV